ncbi:MFS transporter [Corynebacterium uberis]|uniref:MFS transporter n=1 Tax=Corynebacterium TaxID=1716 RepID=UPI001D0A5E35|nr:aromatic acid/H+ symport family MFS transporter [Corynebacterium uberis]MCZ9309418.1 aromatic acid/H+ symport family MFS transporter [Corynebacterium sp. c6VSa_13]UDL72967.1 aromatic acid/H+ symport family MFS transporter [Corynebacterium uberis]UDL76156.1 aromatic acid/H+ symport family MFS transporter [Corynebacterium uberis]UDL80651.1 aromatic acid/H+ symport family MFS transporter [Corynebacterium uberis]UDL82786.1 aromatic acid/H+ symport family MFS transporter [Corynebacterium uberis]
MSTDPLPSGAPAAAPSRDGDALRGAGGVDKQGGVTTRLPGAIIAICGAAIAFDGYDIVVYGTTLSRLRDEWGLDPSTAGLVGSSALAGMLLGAILVGSFASLWGRKRTFLACLIWFSVLMAACAAAGGPVLFAVLRFLAGLGLGGVMPLAAALTTEFAPPGRRAVAYVLMQSGYPIGGVAASLIAMWVIPNLSWHWMYLIGALPLITVVPAAWKWLPDSREDAASNDHTAGLRIIFAPHLRAMTIAFWAISFCSLLFVYGANTWLPALMEANGHAFRSSLAFLMCFNAGAIIGGIAAGVVADKLGSRIVVTASFIIGAVAICAFAFVGSTAVLLGIAIFAGYGAVATQTLINGWVTRSYPAAARTTGVGWSLGMGRLGAIIGPWVTGVLVASTGASQAPFLLFAATALVGAGLSWILRKAGS